jgi:glutamate-1-semialdehyde 2,1-aminomutase
MKNNRSKEIFNRLKKSIPGGVNSPVRAFKSVDGDPIVIKSGKGSIIQDVDGNQYIDFMGSWGPLILGHAHPVVVEAVLEAVEKGMSFGASTESEAELAEMIIQAVPSIDMIRFVNSGTEATMSAVRLARAYTKRDIIIKFEGCYHGHADLFLSKSGSGMAAMDEPISSGIPNSIISKTITLPYNDLDSVEKIFQKKGDKIAAVIVEPIAGNMGVILPKRGFLEKLRSTTEQTGSILIFDEVITGFRVDYGGAQKIYNISPDLTCLGKIIGGGFPVGAYGGNHDIMQMVAPQGSVYQAGTLSGNPIAMSAGLSTLKILNRSKIYSDLEKIGAYVEKLLTSQFKKKNIKVQIPRCGSMFGIFFSSSKINNWNDVQLSKLDFYKKFHLNMIKNGIYLPPSPFESYFISTCHSKKDIKKLSSAIKKY